MTTPADVRKIALALEGVKEVDHWGRPRLPHQEAHLRGAPPRRPLSPFARRAQAFLFEADPATFVKFMWGKTPEIIVQLDRIAKKELAALLREAWDQAAPPYKPAQKRVSSG